MPDTFTSTYTVIVPVRVPIALDAQSLTTLLESEGLRVEMPESARLDRHEYVPVKVFVDGREVHTGLKMGWSVGRALELDGSVGCYSVWAKDAPIPADWNEVPLAWYVATALARAGQGAVLDPASDAVLGPDAAAQQLRAANGKFDVAASAWEEYAYDLFRAAEDGDVAGVVRELERGVSIESRDSIGMTPLLVSLRRGSNPALARELIARGARFDVESRYHTTVLDAAVHVEDADLLQEIVAKGAPAAPTAFRVAGSNETKLLEQLLDAGVPVDTVTPGGWTLLMFAIYRGRIETAQMLLRRGASLTLKNADGATPLIVAAQGGFPELVSEMLERGSDPEHRANNGETALEWAARLGKDTVVDVLQPRSAKRVRDIS